MGDIIGYCGLSQAGPMLVQALSALHYDKHASLAAVGDDGSFNACLPGNAPELAGRCGFLHTRAQLFSTRNMYIRTYAGNVESHGSFNELVRRGSRQFVGSLFDCLSSVRGRSAMFLIHRDHPNVLVGASLGLPLYLGLSDKGWFLSTTEWVFPPSCDTPLLLPPRSFCVISPEKYDLYDLQGNHREERPYCMKMTVTQDKRGTSQV